MPVWIKKPVPKNWRWENRIRKSWGQERSLADRLSSALLLLLRFQDAEFRLSTVLTEEYATIIDASCERCEIDGDVSEPQNVASEIALAVQQKKRM